jgi:hypothetical protein
MLTAETQDWCELHSLYMSGDISIVSECVTLSSINYYYSTECTTFVNKNSKIESVKTHL